MTKADITTAALSNDDISMIIKWLLISSLECSEIELTKLWKSQYVQNTSKHFCSRNRVLAERWPDVPSQIKSQEKKTSEY